MKPTVGRIVHYVSHGTPFRPDGSQAFAAQCRAAIVTEVGEVPDTWIGLVALNPTGMFFHSLKDGGCHYHEGDLVAANDYEEIPTGISYEGGSWHWPERVED